MIRKFTYFRPHGSIQPYLYENQPDIFSTAFWLSFSALGCDFSVRSVSVNPSGRMGNFLSIARKMGLNPVKGFSGLKLLKNDLSGISLKVDSENADLIPLLAVITSKANGVSCFSFEGGAEEEEYNRTTLKMTAELARALDMDYIYFNDRLMINGNTSTLKGGIIDAAGDYRFVMASVLASCATKQQISISYFECAQNKYPDFENDLAELYGREF